MIKKEELTTQQKGMIEWALFGDGPVRDYRIEASASVPGGIYAEVIEDPHMHCIWAVLDGQIRVI